MVRWLKLTLVVIVACGFLAMMIYALINRDEIRSSQVEPPLITAASEPLKRRPDQPGGMQIPNRDKLVFDLLDGGSGTVPGPVPAENSGLQVAEEPEVAVVAPSPTVVVEPSPTKVEEKQVVQEPAAVSKEPVKVVEKKEIAPATPRQASGWGVQVAAVGDRAAGDKAAAQLEKTYDVLKPLTARVVAAPDGKRFRVQFSGAKSRADAAAVCAKLVGKQPCFPVAIQ